MVPDDIDAFNSAKDGDILRIWNNTSDLIHRLNMALTASDSIKALKKRITDEADQKTIEGHIKQIEKLLPLAKSMEKEAKKFMELKPEKYVDMPHLLQENLIFFTTANKCLDKATLLRSSMTVSGKPFYSKTLTNTHMTVINDKIQDVENYYQKLRISYRKYPVVLSK